MLGEGKQEYLLCNVAEIKIREERLTAFCLLKKIFIYFQNQVSCLGTVPLIMESPFLWKG